MSLCTSREALDTPFPCPALTLPCERRHAAKIGAISQRVLKEGISAPNRFRLAIPLPSAVFEHLQVVSLDLCILAFLPGLESASSVGKYGCDLDFSRLNVSGTTEKCVVSLWPGSSIQDTTYSRDSFRDWVLKPLKCPISPGFGLLYHPSFPLPGIRPCIP